MHFLQTRSSRLRTLLVSGMIAGVAVFAVGVYFIITGEYASLTERQATEALLNKLAIGGLLFSTANWYVDQFLRPSWGNKASA